MACEGLAPMKKCCADKVFRERMGVISEELMQCGSDLAATGWRKDEPKELVTQNVKLVEALMCAPGSKSVTTCLLLR